MLVSSKKKNRERGTRSDNGQGCEPRSSPLNCIYDQADAQHVLPAELAELGQIRISCCLSQEHKTKPRDEADKAGKCVSKAAVQTSTEQELQSQVQEKISQHASNIAGRTSGTSQIRERRDTHTQMNPSRRSLGRRGGDTSDVRQPHESSTRNGGYVPQGKLPRWSQGTKGKKNPARSVVFNPSAHGVIPVSNADEIIATIFSFVGCEYTVQGFRALSISCNRVFFGNWRRYIRLDVTAKAVMPIMKDLLLGRVYNSPRYDLLPQVLVEEIRREHEALGSKIPTRTTEDNKVSTLTYRHLQWYWDGAAGQQQTVPRRRLTLKNVDVLNVTDQNSSVRLISQIADAARAAEQEFNSREPPGEFDPVVPYATECTNAALATFPDSYRSNGTVFPPVTSTGLDVWEFLLTSTGMRPTGVALQLSVHNSHILDLCIRKLDWSRCDQLLIRCTEDTNVYTEISHFGPFTPSARPDRAANWDSTGRWAIDIRDLPKTLKTLQLWVNGERLIPPNGDLQVSDQFQELTYCKFLITLVSDGEFYRVVAFIVTLLRGSPNLKKLSVSFRGPSEFASSKSPSRNWHSCVYHASKVIEDAAAAVSNEGNRAPVVDITLQRCHYPRQVVGRAHGFLRALGDRLVERTRMSIAQRPMDLNDRGRPQFELDMTRWITLLEGLRIRGSETLRVRLFGLTAAVEIEDCRRELAARANGSGRPGWRRLQQVTLEEEVASGKRKRGQFPWTSLFDEMLKSRTEPLMLLEYRGSNFNK